jgi:transposase-like protein
MYRAGWKSSSRRRARICSGRRVTTSAEALMGAEADAVCGAAYGERSTERTNNGYRRRDQDTPAGSISLAIPRLWQGSYFLDWLPGTPPPR